MHRFRNATIALSLGGAIAVTSMVPLGGPAMAAPLSMNAAALTEAAPGDVIEVRRRHRSGAIVAGLALGIIGAVIAHQEYKRHRRHYGYYYYEPYPRCIRKYGAWYCR